MHSEIWVEKFEARSDLKGLSVDGEDNIKVDYKTKCGYVAGYGGFSVRVKWRSDGNKIT